MIDSLCGISSPYEIQCPLFIIFEECLLTFNNTLPLEKKKEKIEDK